MYHARTVLRLLTTNSEARKLLLDIRYFAREMLAKVIQHEADAIHPKPHEMAAIDRHAAGYDAYRRGEGAEQRRRTKSEARRMDTMERSYTNVDAGGGTGGAKKRGRSVDIKR